jgi:hypothetical protein
MSSCPEFKAQIDRSLDLNDRDREALGAHLVSCASCAEYKADADRTMALLRELRQRLTPTAPVDQAFERLSARLAALRRQTVWTLVLIAVCVATPFAMLLRSPLDPIGLGLLALCLVGACVLVWQAKREQSAMLSFTRRTSGFYASWQRDLERKIRMLTGGGVLVGAWSIGFLFYSVLGPFGIVERLVVLCTAVLLGVGALHTLVVELRQLKDELALVQDASRG